MPPPRASRPAPAIGGTRAPSQALRSRASSAATPSRERRLAEHVDRRGPGAAGVAEHQPRLDGAVPAVRLEPDGGLDRLVRRRGQAMARAELHAARARAAGVQRERDVAALPHRARIGEVGGRDEQRHRRVAVAERREPLELLGERRASARRLPRRRRCAPAAPGRPASAPRRRARRTTPGTRRRRRARSSGRRRRGGRRGGRGGELDAVSPASRSNAGIERPDPVPSVAVERDQDRRPVVALGDPGGHDPDHARVPALAGQHVRRARGRARPPAPRRRTGSASRRRAARRSPRRARRRSRAPAPDPRSAAARARRRRGAGGRRR